MLVQYQLPHNCGDHYDNIPPTLLFTFSCTMSDQVQAAVTHDLLVRELGQVPQWDVLGTYLGLDESEIEVIERDHHDTARRRLVMLSTEVDGERRRGILGESD